MSVANPAAAPEALAAFLDEHGLVTYLPDGVYPDDVPHPAVYFGDFPAAPQAGPDLAVTVNRYNTNTDQDDWNPFVWIQLNWRSPGPPRSVEQLADDAFQVLQQTSGIWPGGVAVQSVTRAVTAPAVRDSNGLWTRADSYQLILNPHPGGNTP